jgi:hypothetical protein
LCIRSWRKSGETNKIVITGLKIYPNETHEDNHKKIDQIFEELHIILEHREDEKFIAMDNFDFKFVGKIEKTTNHVSYSEF